jgi:hypothetical protein
MYRCFWQIGLGDKVSKPAGYRIGMNRLPIILCKDSVGCFPSVANFQTFLSAKFYTLSAPQMPAMEDLSCGRKFPSWFLL